jgi:hypothetical protein
MQLFKMKRFLVLIALAISLLATLPLFAQTNKDTVTEKAELHEKITVPTGQITPILTPSTGVGDNEFGSEKPNLPAITDYYNSLLGVLTFLWGFIARAFRLNVKFPNFVFVVLAGGVTLAGIFIHYGLTGGLTAAFTIISTMGLFDIIKGGTRQLSSLSTTSNERLKS